jgi:hypothetical protein
MPSYHLPSFQVPFPYTIIPPTINPSRCESFDKLLSTSSRIRLSFMFLESQNHYQSPDIKYRMPIYH